MMISKFLPEREHFTFDEILFLELLMYTSNETPFFNILDAKGMTIRQWVDAIDENLLEDDKIYRGYVSGLEWKKILHVMRSRERLLNVRIAETHADEDYGGGGGLAAVMICEKNKEAVVAFRGTATREWVDDFSGANRADTLQQLNALEWYRSVYRKCGLSRYYVTLAGHSKGGNKAKYITILDDTPDRCFSIDGQGFSDAFFAAYGERILKRQDRIENHSIDFDSINALMTEVGREYFYTGFDYGKLGYIETHSMVKFFKWENDGEYSIHPSTEGQSAEMLSLKHFFNSYIRSIASEEDQNEMAKCLGLIVQKSNEINDARKDAEEFRLKARLEQEEKAGTEERQNEQAGSETKGQPDTWENAGIEGKTDNEENAGLKGKTGTGEKSGKDEKTDTEMQADARENTKTGDSTKTTAVAEGVEYRKAGEHAMAGVCPESDEGADVGGGPESGKSPEARENPDVPEKEEGAGKADLPENDPEKEKSDADFIGFVCDLIADPVYTDKVAFLIAFLIRYQKLHPEFITELKDIPERFGMEEMGKYAEYLDSILNWKELNRAITVTGFLSEHLPKGVVRQLQLKLNKSLNLNLDREQFLCLLSIISRVKEHVNSLEIRENPPEELMESGLMQPEVTLPEENAEAKTAEEQKEKAAEGRKEKTAEGRKEKTAEGRKEKTAEGRKKKTADHVGRFWGKRESGGITPEDPADKDPADKDPADKDPADKDPEMDTESGESMLHIVVLAGGFSAERNISLLTGARVTKTLREMGHRVIFLDSYMGCSAKEEILEKAFDHTEELSSRPFVSVDVMPDLWTVQRRRPGTDPAIIGPNVLRLCKIADLVFVGLHNACGEYGKLQGTFDLLGIRYTGDDYEATALAMNKDLTKRLLKFAGFETPDWAIVTEEGDDHEELPENLTFPVVVKPCCGGSGIGVSFAWDLKSYRSALEETFHWEKKALVERFLPGREFSVSILGEQILPPVEICLPSGIYNYQTRFETKSAYFRCPVEDDDIREKLNGMAAAAAKELGITAYCRMDFRMADDGKIMILECDTLPDMTEGGLLEAEIEAAGVSFEELCRIILQKEKSVLK